MALPHMFHIPLVIGSANDGTDDLRNSLDLVSEAEVGGVE
jgi:hypothetical protein